MNAQPLSRPGRIIAALALPLLALALLVGLLALSLGPASAHSQSLAAPQAAAPAPAGQAQEPAGAAGPAADAAAPLEDCAADAPAPPGQEVVLADEDEINLTWRFRDDDRSLQTAKLDLDSTGKSLVMTNSTSTGGGLTNVGLTAAVVTDLNATSSGDRKHELVTAFKDSSSRIGVVSSAVPGTEWYMSGGAYDGGNVAYVDIAAGDLGRGGTYPLDDEVVVAFRDDNYDLHLITLNGKGSTGGINHSPGSFMSEYVDSTEGRGNVWFVAVETGDFNGDGNDDEIVTVFKDSDSDLQAVVLRHDGTTTLTKLWSKKWQNHDRGNVAADNSLWNNARNPIDVTTGDIDGDHRDEIIAGFRVGGGDDGDLQLLVLDPSVDTKGTATLADDVYSFDDRVWWNHKLDDYYAMAALSVSLSAADFDGDGVDEIAVGYGSLNCTSDHEPRAWKRYLVSYEYVPITSSEYTHCTNSDGRAIACSCIDDDLKPVACLQQRPGRWASSRQTVDLFSDEAGNGAVVSVDTGDIDADGYAEIALAWQESADIRTEVFNADSGVTSSPSFEYKYDGSSGMEDFWLAVGDRDGDAKWGVYRSCHVKHGAQVMAVVHAPPYWSDEEMYPNTWETEAAFGADVGKMKGGAETNTSTIGGHVDTEVDIGAAFSKYGEKWKGIGPVFTRGWETSWSTGHEAMTTTFGSLSFSSFTPHEANDSGGEPDFDQLGVVETHDWCYVYYEPSLGNIDVCLPFPSGDMAFTPYNLEVWWADLAEEYPDTWVPVGRNLAKGLTGAVSQTSNYTALTTADKAVDGNRSGDWNAESMAATGGTAGVYSYWQLDLGNGITDPAGAHSTLGRQWINGILLWNRTDCCSDRLKGAYVFVSDKPFTSNDPNTLKADPNVWTHQLSTTDTPEQRTIVPVNRYGRYVRVQLPQAGLCLYLGEVEVYGVPATPKDWPAIEPSTDTPAEGQYQLTWRDGHKQDVTGDFLWSDALAPAMGVRNGGGVPDIATGGETERYIIEAGETASEKSVGLKIKGKTIAFDWGSSETKEYRTGWSAKVEFSAAVNGLSMGADPPDALKKEFEYDVHSYVWVQRDVSRDGMEQAFPVLDYWVKGDVGADPPAGPPAPTGPFLTPMLPQLDSPTHPDEGTWYAANTATFTWAQPHGDPAAITGYRLRFDQAPGTIPPHYSPEPDNTHTFEGLADGVWTMHVVAASGNEWSETAHRKIQVDATPPAITLKLDPPLPTGNNGWYNTPVDVIVTASDGNGSGVAAIETSTDGVTWQPYTGPRTFNADTPGTKVYARATDGIGHVSAVLTASFKIDMTPPDSQALFAGIVTGPFGNQQLVLTGDIEDALSGRAGMHLGIDRLGTGDPAGLDWTSASDMPDAPGIRASWYFTATRELGAGNHRFFGQAQDAAGNVEAPYEIATVLWPPTASPDIAGSSVIVSPTVVRPGEDLTFSMTARNGGFQDAYVGVTAVLPEGLVPLTETLSTGVTYDEASRTLTWPPELLWPGEWMRSTFQAHADAGLAAGTLGSQFTFHAGWPNTESLPPADRQKFLDHEQTSAATASVRIDPALPAGADVAPPWAGLLRAASDVALGGPVAPLAINTSEQAGSMYIREWTLDPTTGRWTVARSSGWIAFSPTVDWTLSAGHGVKYIGVWVRDAAGNVSALDEDAVTFADRWDGNATLAAGQRVQYRGNLQRGQPIVAELTTVAGDPDLFGWWPDNGFAPNLYSVYDVGAGQTEAIGEDSLHASGRYLVEVASLGASEYTLAFPRQLPEAIAAARVAGVKPLPQHPLAVSDPLSAGQLGPQVTGKTKIYLPWLLKQ